MSRVEGGSDGQAWMPTIFASNTADKEDVPKTSLLSATRGHKRITSPSPIYSKHYQAQEVPAQVLSFEAPDDEPDRDEEPGEIVSPAKTSKEQQSSPNSVLDMALSGFSAELGNKPMVKPRLQINRDRVASARSATARDRAKHYQYQDDSDDDTFDAIENNSFDQGFDDGVCLSPIAASPLVQMGAESACLSPLPLDANEEYLEQEATHAFASPTSMASRRLGNRLPTAKSATNSVVGSNHGSSFEGSKSRRSRSKITNDEQAYLFHAMNRALEIKSPTKDDENPELAEKLRQRARERAEMEKPPSPIHFRDEEGEKEKFDEDRFELETSAYKTNDEKFVPPESLLVLGSYHIHRVKLIQKWMRGFLARLRFRRMKTLQHEQHLRTMAGRLSRNKFLSEARQRMQAERQQRMNAAARVIFRAVLKYHGKCVLNTLRSEQRLALQALDLHNRTLDSIYEEGDTEDAAIEMELESWIESRISISARILQRFFLEITAKRRRENLMAVRIQEYSSATLIACMWRMHLEKDTLDDLREQRIMESRINAANVIRKAYCHHRAILILDDLVELRREQNRLDKARLTIYRAIAHFHAMRFLDRLIEKNRGKRIAEKKRLLKEQEKAALLAKQELRRALAYGKTGRKKITLGERRSPPRGDSLFDDSISDRVMRSSETEELLAKCQRLDQKIAERRQRSAETNRLALTCLHHEVVVQRNSVRTSARKNFKALYRRNTQLVLNRKQTRKSQEGQLENTVRASKE